MAPYATCLSSAPVASPLFWLRAVLTAVMLPAIAGFLAGPAHAAPIDCLPMQQALIKIPEIASDNGVLGRTILLTDELHPVPTRTPPQSVPGDLTQRTANACFAQCLRVYHVGG